MYRVLLGLLISDRLLVRVTGRGLRRATKTEVITRPLATHNWQHKIKIDRLFRSFALLSGFFETISRQGIQTSPITIVTTC